MLEALEDAVVLAIFADIHAQPAGVRGVPCLSNA